MNENRDRVHSEGEDSQEYENFILELLKAEENYSGKSVTGDRILHGGLRSPQPRCLFRTMAKTQNNLAVAYSNRIRGEKAENIERAIAYYTPYKIV